MPQTQTVTLVCYDGSDSAKRAIEVLSQKMPGEEITLLHVWNEPTGVLTDSFSDSGAPGPSVAQLERIEVERAREIVEEGETVAKEHGLQVTTLIEQARSDSWRTILKVADRLDAGLIVLGTRAHVVFDPGLLGSVSGGIVWGSKHPVLIVPTPASDET